MIWPICHANVFFFSWTYVKRLTRPECNYTFCLRQSKVGFSKNEKKRITLVGEEEFSLDGIVNPWCLSNTSFIYLLQWYITLVQVTDGCSQLPFLIPRWKASINSDSLHVPFWKKALTGRPVKLFDPRQRTPPSLSRGIFVFICLEAHSDHWVRRRHRHFAAAQRWGPQRVMECPSPGVHWSLWQAIHFAALSCIGRNGQTPPAASREMEGQPISGSTAEPRCCLGKQVEVGHGRTLRFTWWTSPQMHCHCILFMFTRGMWKSDSFWFVLNCSSFLDFEE